MIFKAILNKKKKEKKKQNKLILYLLKLYKCSFHLFPLIRIPMTLVSKKRNLHKFQATLKYQSVAFKFHRIFIIPVKYIHRSAPTIPKYLLYRNSNTLFQIKHTAVRISIFAIAMFACITHERP